MSLFTGHIDIAYCREIQPSKPNVDPFLKICEEWNLSPTQLLLAGDHLDDFIASIGTILFLFLCRTQICILFCSTSL